LVFFFFFGRGGGGGGEVPRPPCAHVDGGCLFVCRCGGVSLWAYANDTRPHTCNDARIGMHSLPHTQGTPHAKPTGCAAGNWIDLPSQRQAAGVYHHAG